jgi:hypothetical protein
VSFLGKVSAGTEAHAAADDQSDDHDRIAGRLWPVTFFIVCLVLFGPVWQTLELEVHSLWALSTSFISGSR